MSNLNTHLGEDVIIIDHKISLEEYAKLIQSGRSVRISSSILDQSKGIRILTETLEKIYKLPAPPKIEISGRKKPSKLIKQDWMDPYLRTLVGERPPSGLALEMELFRLGAVTKDKAMPISEFTIDEIREVPTLKEAGHIDITPDLRIFLTKFGAKIADGGIRIYE